MYILNVGIVRKNIIEIKKVTYTYFQTTTIEVPT